MKTIKILLVLLLNVLARIAFSQEIPSEVVIAIKTDDPIKLAPYITKGNVNDCYEDYSLLSQTIRNNAIKCFNLLIEKGADVNRICNNYLPPLMHAAKYGHLDMVKILISKGANINYVYKGDFEPANGKSPLTYAEEFKQTDVVNYLRTLK